MRSSVAVDSSSGAAGFGAALAGRSPCRVTGATGAVSIEAGSEAGGAGGKPGGRWAVIPACVMAAVAGRRAGGADGRAEGTGTRRRGPPDGRLAGRPPTRLRTPAPRRPPPLGCHLAQPPAWRPPSRHRWREGPRAPGVATVRGCGGRGQVRDPLGPIGWRGGCDLWGRPRAPHPHSRCASRGAGVPSLSRRDRRPFAFLSGDQGVRGQPGHGRRQGRARAGLQLLRPPADRVDRAQPAGVRLRGVRGPSRCRGRRERPGRKVSLGVQRAEGAGRRQSASVCPPAGCGKA